MSSYKTRGIVLRRTNYGEADRIMTFLTPSHGKVEAIAKGVRRQGAKLASHLEPFNEVELMFAGGKNLDVVTSARLTVSFKKLPEDYERLRRAFLFCEMLNKLTDTHTGEELYRLLKGSLAALNGGLEPNLTELYFKLHLLDQLGHKPDLGQVKPARSVYYFDVESGNVKLSPGASTEKLEADEVKLIKLMYSFPLKNISHVKGLAEPAKHLLGIINRFYDYVFGKRFKAAEI